MNNKINKIENLNKNLQILDLRNNKILQIENLNEKLQAIDLGKNKIENLKPIVEFIRGKKTNFCIVANDYLCLDEYQINVYSNPLINPPMKIVEEGTAAILRYFEE